MSGLFSNAITVKPEVETMSAEVIPRAVICFGSKALGGFCLCLQKSPPLSLWAGQAVSALMGLVCAAEQTHLLPKQPGRAASAGEP